MLIGLCADFCICICWVGVLNLGFYLRFEFPESMMAVCSLLLTYLTGMFTGLGRVAWREWLKDPQESWTGTKGGCKWC